MPYEPRNRVRIVTAAALFDGHDASINLMRRLLQDAGVEVIHLGHNRAAHEVVDAAIQEDVQAIAVSSYQGGHMEYLRYMRRMLDERQATHVRIFGGGGGVIVPREIEALEREGIARIFSPEDGQRLGLRGMVDVILAEADFSTLEVDPRLLEHLPSPEEAWTPLAIGRLITLGETIALREEPPPPVVAELRARAHARRPRAPVLGITGPGGAGKSSLTDELVARLLEDFTDRRIAILSVDPSKRRTGGALLGDRIRMNAVDSPCVYMRSLATRSSGTELSAGIEDALSACQAAGFDIVFLETAGIGQGNDAVTRFADLSVYVMTADFGAPTQLEKIEMLDAADIVAINKFERRGSIDALREVRKLFRRTRSSAPDGTSHELPIFGTSASHFNDAGVSRLYARLLELLHTRGFLGFIQGATRRPPTISSSVIPESRTRYLAEIAGTVRADRREVEQDAALAMRAQGFAEAIRSFGVDLDPCAFVPLLDAPSSTPDSSWPVDTATRPSASSSTDESSTRDTASTPDAFSSTEAWLAPDGPSTTQKAPLEPFPQTLVSNFGSTHGVKASALPTGGQKSALEALRVAHDEAIAGISEASRAALHRFRSARVDYGAERLSYDVRGRTVRAPLVSESLANSKIPKVVFPTLRGAGDLVAWLRLENLPGTFPFTAGVFPLKREEEEPTRMFAGEGPPERTNRRFHLLSEGRPSVRLSTAFDSVTLYGEDPDERPDIFGKIGESGVSVATVEDLERLYAGFDLTSKTTSVSMTINGPAPTMLAFYMNAAIRQACRRHLKASGRLPISDAEVLMPDSIRGDTWARVRGLLRDEELGRLRRDTLRAVRGTVQADVLKEDQAQNTCIFSTEFALRMMGDVQAYFIEENVENYYSVSISGYHMAEAGANPITQLALTLANGFTYAEYFLARGMKIDDFAPSLSFFFSNGLDPEYLVLGRVARRIWAIALKHRYGASERSQRLKYHIQTSGRSLHAMEMDFNDIRTTLQALMAIADNCNSLHTNAFDEALTTPTEASVRRAIAIQLIIQRELGLTKNENPLQGSFLVEYLTDLVESEVLAEFDRLAERGGVLGAMETQYQRSKIQEESLKYERLKHDGTLPIVGVNTFRNPKVDYAEQADRVELRRASLEEKRACVENVRDFQRRHAAGTGAALSELKRTATTEGNVFRALMDTVEVASLGQITHALYEIGGRYRRNL